jgi:hypothetical protein
VDIVPAESATEAACRALSSELSELCRLVPASALAASARFAA